MPRPPKRRYVSRHPRGTGFKPAGIPGHALERIQIGLDELESLRLADAEGLYHDEAAQSMGVSRATFGRLVQAARRKVARALLEGKMLVFEGGPVTNDAPRAFACRHCGGHFQLPLGTGPPGACPACGSAEVGRLTDNCGRLERRRRRDCRWADTDAALGGKRCDKGGEK